MLSWGGVEVLLNEEGYILVVFVRSKSNTVIVIYGHH
jgi:hypothetical protein